MIKIRLMTRHNLTLVADIGMPGLNPDDIPDVVIWQGARVFHKLENAGIDEDGRWRYEECAAYFTPVYCGFTT